jgi:hypothetical protein
MGAGRIWSLPAEGRLVMCKWHDATFHQQRTRPGSIVDPGRDWLQPTEGRPAMRKWHGARQTQSGKFESGRTCYGEPQNDGRLGGNASRHGRQQWT